MNPPEEIVPGVFGVLQGFGNAFVLVDDDVTLIDAGLARRYEKLSGALNSIGREITNIALTHHHFDHVGCLTRLATGEVRIFAHPLEAEIVRGDRPTPGFAIGGPLKLVLTVLRPVLFGGDPPRCRVDREIVEGDEIPGSGGLRAMHTPGHTAGHLSFLHPAKRILFVGDAATNQRQLGLPPRPMTEDMDEAKRTLRQIAALDFDTAVFGHGKVLKGRANAEFRKLVDSLAE
jgi:glyoxylase-like metal-dependent hydrolase (beta-lactamase superfamily II)